VNFNVAAKPQFLPVGEWLSLVEHLVRDQGVGGSNPLSPTISIKHLQQIQRCTFWVQFVQLAIGVPIGCGNQGQLALPWPSGKQHPFPPTREESHARLGCECISIPQSSGRETCLVIPPSKSKNDGLT
jgi:hypothetical protein